jgi:hypothetical protein
MTDINTEQLESIALTDLTETRADISAEQLESLVLADLAVLKEPPFNFRVFYDPATGTIYGYEHTNSPSEREGQAYLDFAEPVPWDPTKYKVDLETGTIVEMTPPEIYEAQLPKVYEVESAIYNELNATLETQFPDYTDSEEERAEWSTYRRALRKLHEKGDALAMLNAWPERPDKRETIGHLRSRVKPKG